MCVQVDRASAMIEKLCTPSDDDHNEHKKLQLRELAVMNGGVSAGASLPMFCLPVVRCKAQST